MFFLCLGLGDQYHCRHTCKPTWSPGDINIITMRFRRLSSSPVTPMSGSGSPVTAARVRTIEHGSELLETRTHDWTFTRERCAWSTFGHLAVIFVYSRTCRPASREIADQVSHAVLFGAFTWFHLSVQVEPCFLWQLVGPLKPSTNSDISKYVASE